MPRKINMPVALKNKKEITRTEMEESVHRIWKLIILLPFSLINKSLLFSFQKTAGTIKFKKGSKMPRSADEFIRFIFAKELLLVVDSGEAVVFSELTFASKSSIFRFKVSAINFKV